MGDCNGPIKGFDLPGDLGPLLHKKFGLDVQGIDNQRRVYKLTTRQGLYAFKIIDYDLKDFLYIYSAVEYVYNRGFRRVARFHSDKEGMPYLNCEDGNFFICKWIDGHECNYDYPRELTGAVVSLAELHLAASGFRPYPDPDVRSNWGKWPETFRARATDLQTFKDIVINKRSLTRFDRLFLNEVDLFYEQALAAVELLENSPYQELSEKGRKQGGFCHHDMAYHNVLINQRLAYLIDFDYCLGDLALHDLTSLILRNLKSCRWDTHRAEFILERYNKVKTVRAEEMAIMWAMMNFPQDFWQYAFSYYQEDIGRSEKGSLRRLRRAVKNQKDRAAFLKDFRNFI